MNAGQQRLAYATVARLGSGTAHEAYVVQFCRALATTGCAIELAAAELPGGASGLAARFGAIPDGFRLRLLGRASPRPGRWHEFQVAWRLLARRSCDIELWITHHPVLALAAVLHGVRWVFDFHQIDPRSRLIRLLLRHSTCAGALFNSQAALAKFRQLNGTLSVPALVSHNAINGSLFARLPTPAEARRVLGLPEQGFVFAYVGSIGPNRGVETIIEAVALLSQSGVVVSCLIVGGEGERLAAIRRLVAASQAASRFVVPGGQPHANIAHWYAAADCLLAPYSPLLPAAAVMNPMKLYEYAAAGKPVIASDLPAVREAMEGNPAALLVPADSADALAAAMQHFVGNARALGEAACRFRPVALANTWDAKAANLALWLRALSGDTGLSP